MRRISSLLLLAWLAAPVWAEARFQKHANLTYVKRGDLELRADVFVPDGEGPFPAVLMIHGGAWRYGAKWQMAGHANKLAAAGYTVVSINYRLAPDHQFPAQIHDCKEAIRWMRRNADQYKIDANRIAAYGYSAGAHLACLVGVTGPEDGLEGADSADSSPGTRVQAVVGGGSPCDFRWLSDDSRSLVYFLGGSRAEKPEMYRKASPMSFVTSDDPPVFLYHGSTDKIVPIGSAKRMKESLYAAGVRATLHVCEGKGHFGAFFDSDSIDKSIDFLNDVLKSGE